jgi:folate-binding protein YgfZ
MLDCVFRVTPKAAMPPAPPSRIGPAGIVDIAGADALSFAHAQFASNVSALPTGSWHWSSWLDAQGRVRNVFALGRQAPDHLLVWLPLGDADAMAAALSRYVLRSKATVRASQEWQLSVDEIHESTEGAAAVAGEQWSIALPGGHTQAILARVTGGDSAPVDDRALDRLLLAAVEAGLPWLADVLSGEFVAPALGLAPLGATRLDKGCYPGQEIVARLHYRGGNKRHLARLRMAPGTHPSPGDPVFSSSGPERGRSGRVLYAATADDGSGHALAILDDAGAASAALFLDSGAIVQRVENQLGMAR